MEGTTGLEEVQSAVCSLHRSKCHETVPRSKIFGWHNVPACQNGKLHVDFIIRQEELSVREQTGRLTVMVEVLPGETRHCAPPVPWVMDARPWDRVLFSRHHKKTLQTTGLLDVTHVAVNAQLDVQLTSEQNSLQEKQHGLKYCAFK